MIEGNILEINMKDLDILVMNVKSAATKTSGLKRHIESNHGGMRYPCICEYILTKASYLMQHIESKHEGGRYPCDQC